jgi:hypothetical protein
MTDKITKPYCELSPAYGRDYKTQTEAKEGFNEGKDWEGDYSLGFKLCSIRDFADGTPVLLRYNKLKNVVSIKVGAKEKLGRW